MANQQQSEIGTLYDGGDVVGEVTYELNGTAPGATGILTFSDILAREQVLALSEEKSLTLATAAGQRWSFLISGVADGSSPVLSIQLGESQ